MSRLPRAFRDRRRGPLGVEPPPRIRRRVVAAAVLAAVTAGTAVLTADHEAPAPARRAGDPGPYRTLHPVGPPLRAEAEITGSPRPRRPARRDATAGVTGGDGCGAVSADLVPSCGAWWGVSPGVDSLEYMESRFGRRFDLVHFWYGIDSVDVPDAAARRLARQGRILHINIAGRAFGGGRVRWRQIAEGRWDRTLARQARGIAALGAPVFVTFDHEPDTPPKLRTRGTGADFVAAWRRVHDVYRRNGADNAVWVWVLTGYPGNFPRAAGFYPGDRYVDWIGWEAYQAYLCDGRIWRAEKYASFEDTLKPFHDWLKSEGVKAGIDPRKPYMINGLGAVRYTDPALSARWYREIPATLRRYPQIKAVQLWQPPKGMRCPWRIFDRPAEVEAFARAGQDPYVNQRRPGG
ncbi:glycosyl hydrolase family 26 [Thermomonospora catenispora]|uniref:glycosyl hydrolase family 26 n=1 Tax=Thermomonospora catenispora TaxID=2493090 RepID=UPI001375B4A5|nr:glycosyl hydrolase family 26 [Thermomonospora catenispora]